MAAVQPTVLIVDDEPDILELYATFLADEFQVRTALNGREALDQLDDSVDVVTLDRRMPGMSGDKVAQRIYESAMDCKVIFVSAVDSEKKSYPDCDDYLEKPIDRDGFRQAIHGVL